jgi:hypothetical protein
MGPATLGLYRRPLWPPCAGPKRPGTGYGFPSRSPDLTWAVSMIRRARAGPCREGGLSSIDERVRGHVTEVTQPHRLFESRPNGPRVIYTYNRDDLNAIRLRLDLLDRFHVIMSAAASAKHENFVMSTSHTARAGRRQTARSTVSGFTHLGGPSGPSQTSPQGRYKAAGQMDLLTVPSHDGADMRSRQDVTGRAGLISLLWRPLRPYM